MSPFFVLEKLNKEQQLRGQNNILHGGPIGPPLTYKTNNTYSLIQASYTHVI
ncbi:MAG TPA: hypothetical protein VER14_03185 [Phototrophicaceae bacterium]|nr:hypothetical protein [Phototrophicaceae bacterium]